MLWTLRKVLYRTQHELTKLLVQVAPPPTPLLLTGPGCVAQLADNIRARNLRHVLIVMGKTVAQLGLTQRLVHALEQQKIRHTSFDEVRPNPTLENVEAGVQAYNAHACDAIIAFGGGSSMDCAKLIGARVNNPDVSVESMRSPLRRLRALPPLFAVPTTAGTGSEATLYAVLTDVTTHKKLAATHVQLVPEIAVLDPELLLSLPPHVTAATGMDALTHAVEAYIGRIGTPFTDGNAERATRLIFDNLLRSYDHGSEIEPRSNMALAAFCAGQAISRASVGYVHAISHTVGARYGVAHGLANAIVLPHVLRFCRVEARAKLAQLARVAGVGSPADSEDALCTQLIEHIEGLNAHMHIPQTFAELRAEDIPSIVEQVLREAHPAYPVPRIMTRAQCEALLRQLLPNPSELRPRDAPAPEARIELV